MSIPFDLSFVVMLIFALISLFAPTSWIPSPVPCFPVPFEYPLSQYISIFKLRDSSEDRRPARS